MANSVYGINHVTAYSQEFNTSGGNYQKMDNYERYYDPAVFNNSQTTEKMNLSAGTTITRYLSVTNNSVFSSFYMDNSWVNQSTVMERNTNLTLTVGGRIVTKMCYQETASTQASCEVYYGY